MTSAEDAVGVSARATETPSQALPAVPRSGTLGRLRTLSRAGG